MKKLGKNLYLVKETVQAYQTCTCNCGSATCGCPCGHPENATASYYASTARSSDYNNTVTRNNAYDDAV